LLRGDYSSVVRYSPAGGNPVTLHAPFYVERPRISPDGQNVLYECDYYEEYNPTDNLCRMDASGQVTLYKWIANAVSWSSSGTLAYMRSLDWTMTAKMLVIEPLQALPDPDGPGVTEYPGFDDVTETVWSPDGQRLALVRNGELWIYSLPGMTNPVQIAHVPGTRISSVSWR
jgi:Tol biopolymer transport system component